MYNYYVLRDSQADTPVELEGEIDAEHFPGIDLGDAKAILSCLVASVNREKDTARSWDEAELTDTFFNREDSYIFFDGRWMRRSDAPWRRDRAN